MRSPSEFGEAYEEVTFRACVDRGSWFVHHDEWGVAEELPGDHHALPSADGQLRAVGERRRQAGVVAGGERLDEAVSHSARRGEFLLELRNPAPGGEQIAVLDGGCADSTSGVNQLTVPPVADRLLGRLDHRFDLSDTAAALDQIDDATAEFGCVCAWHLSVSFI
jgi:hypothetical protein